MRFLITAVAFLFHLTPTVQPLDYQTLLSYLVNGAGKGLAYGRLQQLVDRYGERYSPDSYRQAADFLVERLEGVADRVWTEEVPGVPNWKRGNVFGQDGAALIAPRHKKIPILALGGSVGTPDKPTPITAEAVVVRTFDELDEHDVEGKIVIINAAFEPCNPYCLAAYYATLPYRKFGAVEAAKRGAIAVLIRSITPFSLHTLHTGMLAYAEGVPEIPAASITMEDGQFLQRLQNMGETLKIQLLLTCGIDPILPTYSSLNIIAEIRGNLIPDEMVLFGAHLDSWDVGQGALDDAAGVSMVWQVIAAVQQLRIRPKRTLRAVFFAGEETGLIGAKAYYKMHFNESRKISVVLESDTGTFKPLGFYFTGNKQSRNLLQRVVNLLEPINATSLVTTGIYPVDFNQFIEHGGVPALELHTEDDKYFWYHHSEADTAALIDSDELDKCTALMGVTVLEVANLDQLLPRNFETESTDNVLSTPLPVSDKSVSKSSWSNYRNIALPELVFAALLPQMFVVYSFLN